jgi:hypothetical protein
MYIIYEEVNNKEQRLFNDNFHNNNLVIKNIIMETVTKTTSNSLQLSFFLHKFSLKRKGRLKCKNEPKANTF